MGEGEGVGVGEEEGEGGRPGLKEGIIIIMLSKT